MIPFDEPKYCLEKLEKYINAQNKKISDLYDKIKLLESEHFKDDYIQELKEQLETSRQDIVRGFPISEDELKSIREWQEKHDIEVHKLDTFEKKLRAEGTSGGRWRYKFIPTAIGTIGTIYCNCGACFTFQDL